MRVVTDDGKYLLVVLDRHSRVPQAVLQVGFSKRALGCDEHVLPIVGHHAHQRRLAVGARLPAGVS